MPNVVPLLVARMTYTPFAKPETSMLVWKASSALIDVDKATLPVASTTENVADPFIGLAEVIWTLSYAGIGEDQQVLPERLKFTTAISL